MKGTKSVRFISMFLSVVFLLSMLVVSLVPASAAVAGPDAAAAYMYKFDRGTTDSWKTNYQYMLDAEDQFTLAEGDVYRLSFYYNAPEESILPNGFSVNLPMDFALRYLEGGQAQYVPVSQHAELAPADPGWYYLEYNLTVSDALAGLTIEGLVLHTYTQVTKAETIYFADVKLCKVTNGTAGTNILDGISTEPDLKKWYLFETWGFGTDKTSSTRNDSTLTVMEYDKTLFERPEQTFTVTVEGGAVNGEKTAFKPGEEVTVTADAAPAGQVFDYWTAEGVSLSKPGSASVTFNMPGSNVTLTANYMEDEEDNTPAGGPDASVEYMYKWERGTENDAYSNAFQFMFEANPFTLVEGEVYRFSLYYNAPESSLFPKGYALDNPLNFALRANDDGNLGYLNFIADSVQAAANPDWYYLEFELTVNDRYAGNKIEGFVINNVDRVMEAETIYFADVRLCKVVDGEAGDNILEGINSEGDLNRWYLYEIWGFGAGKTSSTHKGNTLSVMPFDRTLFVRPEVYYTVTVENGTIEGGKTSYRPGDQVTVTANQAAAGEIFDFWSATGVSLSSPGSVSVTFNMPSNDVTLTANYMEDESASINSGSTDNDADSTDTEGESTGNTGNSPDTGDNSVLFVLFALAGSIAFVVTVAVRKKVQNS